MKYFYFFISIFLSIQSANTYANEIDMPTLMQLFAVNKNIKTEFVERKFVRILDSPVESSGELIFIAPAHLEKNTKITQG